jgi:hypothetical protein
MIATWRGSSSGGRKGVSAALSSVVGVADPGIVGAAAGS